MSLVGAIESYCYILIATFCLDAKGSAKKSRLYKSLAKNQCVGRPQTRLTSFRQWFATLSTEPMIFLTPDL
jgi:hypothetical protein